MASVAFLQGRHKIIDRTINWISDTEKAILMKSAYAPAVTADGITTASEIVATGYTGGFAGAGRKTLSGTRSINRDDANTRIELDYESDITWTGIGNGTNDTIGGVVIAKEVTDDTLSLAIVFDDTNNVNTNGGDVTYQVNAEGLLQL